MDAHSVGSRTLETPISNPRLFVATPNYSGAKSRYVASVIGLARSCDANKWGFHWHSLDRESNMDLLRAESVAAFMQNPASHLVFIDADIGFNPLDVARAVAANKPIIGLPMRQKKMELVPCFNTLGEEHLTCDPAQPVVEVESIGTGVMIIRRDVIQTMWNAHVDPNQGGCLLEHTQYGPVVSLFKPIIDEDTRERMGADYSFCKRARGMGYTIHLLWQAKTTHTGDFDFECDLQGLLNG